MYPKFACGSSNYEGSGVGGKLRKPQSRRSSTPYVRPPTATRNPSWLSKLVADPASKLFNFGARRFFATVLPNKVLPPPPPPPPPIACASDEQERRDGLQETAPDVKINDGVKEHVGNVCGTSPSNPGSNGLPELAQLLKQKTFTRSEIDRLTELLKSRALDLPVKDDRHGFELNSSGRDSERHQEFPSILNLNKSESLGAHKAPQELNPAVTTKEQNMQQQLEDKIASPAELAKAYMSSRPAKVSPSALGLRAQMEREVSFPLHNSPYTPKSQLSSLSVKTSGYSGILENGYTTPRSRGRASIYSMARTPYSRFHPATHQKVTGAKSYGDSRATLLTSQSPLGNGCQVASRPMALKRRSSVLDDIGSIGPIRRIRQKNNLSPEKILTIFGKGPGSDFTRSPNQMSNADIRRASTSSASYAHVPRESSEMAAKIFEHLEKMTPKEKSPESKLAAAREGSNFKLTPHMLCGQALRSMEDLDESKLLQNSNKDKKLVDQSVNGLPEFHELTTQNHDPVNSVLPEETLTPDRIVDGSDNSQLGYGAMQCFSSQPPAKKRPFKMSAHEDRIQRDGDCCNKRGPGSVGKGLEKPIADGKSALSEDKSLEKSRVSLKITHATPVLSMTTSFAPSTSSQKVPGEKNIGFNLSTSFASSTSSQKVPSQSTEVGDFPPFFSSGSATSKSNLTSSEVEASSSLKKAFSATKNSAMDNTVNGNQAESSSLAFNSMTTNNILSVDAPSSNLASNGGPLTSSTCLPLTSYSPASFNLANQSFTNTLNNKALSAGPTTSTSAALSDSDLVPANESSSSFSGRVSDNGFSKQINSAPSTITETTDVKVEKVNGLGNFSNSSTVSTFAGTRTFASSLDSNKVSSSGPNSSTSTSSLQAPRSFTTPSSTGFSFGASLPAFGTSHSSMSAEDCMAEDPMQSFTPAAPAFSQSLVSPQMPVSPSPPGFTFGSTSSSPVSPFQFASQQNPSQFQASGSLEFNAGSGFSLGSTDKSGRRIVKPSKTRNRRR